MDNTNLKFWAVFHLKALISSATRVSNTSPSKKTAVYAISSQVYDPNELQNNSKFMQHFKESIFNTIVDSKDPARTFRRR